MSTGKRLAKRSIVGTRVCAPYDGLYLTGTINNIKSPSLDTRDTFYSVLFDGLVNGRRTQFDYRADELVGHGFQTITSSNAKLVKGQRVYMTLNGREIGATVECHDEYTDEVFLTVDITANNANSHLIQTNVKRRLDELRLLESRKSARLIDLDTDYSRLALEGQTEQQIRGRSSSMSSSISSSMSSSSTNTSNGRKRRSSDSSESSDDVMDDCTAAMILMSLSCSPKSPPIIPLETSNESSNTISSCQSPLSSPGKITFFTSSSAPNWSHLDDHSYEYLKPTVRNITPSGEEKTLNGYSCVNNQSKRVTHIKKQGATDSNGSSGLSNMHGNSILSSPINIPNISFSHQYATSAPVAIPSSRANHKYMRLDGTGGSLNAANNNNNSINNHLNCNTNNSIDKGGSSLLLSPPSSSSTNKNSPTKRGRGESRKCRKVYGMDNRDSWCTQCKWKKACSRFTD